MRYIAFVLLIAGSVFCSSVAQCEQEQSQLESLYQELRQHNIELLSDPVAFDVQDLLRKYEQLGIDRYLVDLSEHSNDELNWLYRSVSSIVFYDAEIDLKDDLKKIFDELDRREALQDDHITSIYRHYVRAGKLRKAGAFASRYNELLKEPLPAIPEVVDGSYDPDIGPSVLKVVAPDLPLVRKNIELYDDVTIIVQFDPGCGFSSRLMNSIADNGPLKEFLSERAHLLAARPTDVLRLNAFHSWNENSPFEVFLIEDVSDWPFVTRISTPSFYVLREGQDVESFEGYTSETLERLSEIKEEVVAGSSSE